MKGKTFSTLAGAGGSTQAPDFRIIDGTANVVYTIPSLALFIALPAVIGTQILDPVNVVAGLSVYTVALLLRPVVDALDAVAKAAGVTRLTGRLLPARPDPG